MCLIDPCIATAARATSDFRHSIRSMGHFAPTESSQSAAKEYPIDIEVTIRAFLA